MLALHLRVAMQATSSEFCILQRSIKDGRGESSLGAARLHRCSPRQALRHNRYQLQPHKQTELKSMQSFKGHADAW